ncbi:MAG: D-alanine--D-alanine ligase [Gammaproteobacteria bacterium]
MSAQFAVILHGAVAADAPPDEQDVLVEVETVAQILGDLGFAAERLPLTLDLGAARQRLGERRPAFVFNLVETLAGCGRYIHLAPALLEELGLRYTGAPLNATFLTSNKLAAKQLLNLAGIPTPAWRLPTSKKGRDCPPPWIVKSVWEHASIGLDDRSLTGKSADLQRLFAEKHARFGGDWFAERYIDGREFNLALLAGQRGLEVLPPAEIVFRDFPAGKPKIVGYPAKWDESAFEFHNTPRRFDFPDHDQALLETLKALALRCADVFQLRGYARVDFRVDRHGQPWVLEVNTNPCLAPDAGFAAAVQQAGLTLHTAVARIVATALRLDKPGVERASARRGAPRKPRAAASAWPQPMAP